MDALSNLSLGFGVALTVQNALYCFAGVLLGTVAALLLMVVAAPAIRRKREEALQE
jgi:TctA family transporter